MKQIMTSQRFWGSIAIAICIFNIISTQSQTVCYGVNGDVSGLSPSQGITGDSIPAIYCPNFPDTGCAFFTNNYTFYGNYDMSNAGSLSFTIDYELDAKYDENDKTEIYYDCGFGFILGLTINIANGNAFQHTPYDNIGFPLDNTCDNNSNITIKVTQTSIFTATFDTIYFNFENVCVGPLSQNVISNDDDPIFRQGIFGNSSIKPDVVPVCFEFDSDCINPTILLNYFPIYGVNTGIQYVDDAGNIGVCDIDETTSPSCGNITDVDQCPPITLGNIITANQTKCINIIVPGDVPLCTLEFVGNFTLFTYAELFCDNAPPVILPPTPAPTTPNQDSIPQLIDFVIVNGTTAPENVTVCFEQIPTDCVDIYVGLQYVPIDYDGIDEPDESLAVNI